MNFIVASGPVIVKDRKLMVNKDDKDDFYKFIDGKVDLEKKESLEESCIRRSKEACGAEIEIVKPLSPNILYENPQTKEKMIIVLINFLANLKNPNEIRPISPEEDLKWIDIDEIKNGEGNVSPNVRQLVEKEDI